MKIIKDLIYEFNKNNILFFAAQNTFYFILSIFPFLYILSNILYVMPLPAQNLKNALKMLFPEEVLEIIYSNINTTDYTPSVKSSIPYLLIALWSSSMLIYSLKSVFAVLYGKKNTNNKLFTRILSIMLTTVFLIVTMITSAVMFFASTFISILITHFSMDYSPVLLSLINLILIIFDTVLIYLILPPDRIKLSQAIPGAVAAILCITLSSYGFSYYVRYIADYSRIYGALGSVIVLLLWLYICSVIILSGGVINAKFTKEKDAP